VSGAANSAVLAITEINPFKQLQHLALLFKQGSDYAVKRYLADQMTEFKVCLSCLPWCAVRVLTHNECAGSTNRLEPSTWNKRCKNGCASASPPLRSCAQPGRPFTRCSELRLRPLQSSGITIISGFTTQSCACSR